MSLTRQLLTIVLAIYCMQIWCVSSVSAIFESCDNQTCTQVCQKGNCEFLCPGGTEKCDQVCNGKNCVSRCTSSKCHQVCNDEDCTMTCDGGECEQLCNAKNCVMSCSAKKCNQNCNVESCTLKCAPGVKSCSQLCLFKPFGRCNSSWRLAKGYSLVLVPLFLVISIF